MALLSRKVDYALLILSFLQRNEEGGCARAIAERLGLSRPFVANILKRLCAMHFVESQRGIKGGYVLKKRADKIILTDLMDTLGDSFQLTECCQELPANACDVFALCPIKGPVVKIHQKIRDMLAHVTLADLTETETAEPITLEVTRCL